MPTQQDEPTRQDEPAGQAEPAHPTESPVAAAAAGGTDGVAGEAGADEGTGLDEDTVREVIEAIRPAIQADAGDIFLRGVDAGTGVVEVELVGACVTCPASSQTLKAGIERILKDRVDGVTEVRNIGETIDEFSETPISL